LEEEFPAWRVVVYKKPAGELMSLGRRRIALQYTLLAFSLLALLIGTLTLFQGLDKEQRMVRMKGNFLSAVSHELKTPLTAIRMFAEMLASGRQAQEEKRRQYVQRIGQEAERLQGMIEGILSYTRLEENPDALRFQDLDFCELAREAAALLDGAFAQAGIRLSLRLAPEARLRGDYDALRSVLVNLLENALKYSPAGTEVVLEIRAEAGRVMLRVADQGVGIAPEDQKHIFDKFYRAGDEMTRKTRGSGIGLALVKRIVDAHKVGIEVNSAPRQGTEMLLTFAAREIGW
jgi:signal transduction histidine kinase